MYEYVRDREDEPVVCVMFTSIYEIVYFATCGFKELELLNSRL